MMRALITLSPLIYREAVAQSVRQRRPGFEVRIAPPEAVEEEVRAFKPHLLVRNDTDGIDQKVLAGVPCWVEVIHSDSMDAKISVDGRLEEVSDISTEELLRVADEAEAGTWKP
jgi:hypothetical protein